MKILVLGATGLIGSHLVARLATADHQVVAVSRGHEHPGLLPITHVRMDISRAVRPDDWLPLLHDVSAVVNCAGTLQDAPGDSTKGVHDTGIAALIKACETAGVRRMVHLSAIGVERQASRFSETKLAGDRALMASQLDWIILRPSVVVGRAAYGGSALMRGLAALPIIPSLKQAGPLQLVHLDDVIDTIVFCLKPDAPSRQVFELAGPRTWTFDEAVQLLRRWMRWRKAAAVTLPQWVWTFFYWLGDTVGWLGWRPAVRSTAQREMVHGAAGDANAWQRTTGIAPRDLEQVLANEPASVQERWFAGLYILKPLIFGIFGLFWVASGVISLGPGWGIGLDLMREGGASETMGRIAVVAGAFADIAIGLAVLYRPTSRYGLIAALLLSLSYAVIGTLLVPRLWREPLGPLLKIWPIMTLNLVALAILKDR
jgi:uncharacterized protein YbjT (DUF2867 family)